MKTSYVLVPLVYACLANTSLAGTCSPEGEESLSPDIVAELVDGVTLTEGNLHFKLQVTNCGAGMDNEVQMFNKAFLVPRANYKQSLVGQGVVLPSFSLPVNLEFNQQKTFPVSLTLPPTLAGDYFFGVTLNTRAAPTYSGGGSFPIPIPFRPQSKAIAFYADGQHVPESIQAQDNNATYQMANLHIAEAISGDRPTGKYDLYHEVTNASIKTSAGIGAHSSRNILRIMEGEDILPSPETWDNEISARFLFINPEAGTLQVARYNQMEIDKVWTAIAWQKERDSAAHNIYTDYYSNAPLLHQLSQGDYILGVLMNVTDRFALDSYPANNLDLTYLQVPAQKSFSIPKTVFLNANTNPQAWIYTSSTQSEASGTTWEYEIPNQPEWLKVTAMPMGPAYTLTIETLAGTPMGVHSFTLKTTKKQAGKREEATTALRISRTDGPIPAWQGTESVLTPESPHVNLFDRHGIRYMQVTFSLENRGNRILAYEFGESSGIEFVTPAERQIAANGKHKISFTIPLVGIPLPREESQYRYAYIYETLATNTGNRYLSISYDPVAMLEHQLEP